MSNSDQRGGARLLPFVLSPLFSYGPIRPIYSPTNSRNSPVLRKIPESLGTFSMSEYSLPIYRSLRLNNFETLSCPRSHPGLRTTFGTSNHITHMILYRQRTLSMRTLRVRELCRHDREASSVNKQQRNLDAHIGSHIFYEDLYRSYRNDNICYSLCHRYVTCLRFDRRYPNT